MTFAEVLAAIYFLILILILVFKNYYLNVYDSGVQIPSQEILISSLEVK